VDLKDVLHRASGFLAKTGRGFFDYSGDRREAFETAKVRALLRQLRRQRDA
jgi:hypothetical protein